MNHVVIVKKTTSEMKQERKFEWGGGGGGSKGSERPQGSHSTWKTWKNESTPGQPGKMRVHLENLEISWNFENFNKYQNFSGY